MVVLFTQELIGMISSSRAAGSLHGGPCPRGISRSHFPQPRHDVALVIHLEVLWFTMKTSMLCLREDFASWQLGGQFCGCDTEATPLHSGTYHGNKHVTNHAVVCF
eukprot:TRINITY_DN11860_c1_g1_i3.p5 TRINITY_DN11860_c1_g1~~TRINITY_DN11860_c1_g1_i3.p5  ORF type:complete len:106 (-),score=1.60 TRINITY_DN11860_c1_g1_i3:80-397(-)